MTYRSSNNSYFSYQGTISRKDYAINMLILVALYVGMSFIKFESFTQYTNFKFLSTVLLFMAGLFKFVILMSAISVVYRRFADIGLHKSFKFNMVLKRLFVLLFVIPLLYTFCIRYFFDILPILINFIDSIIFLALLPLSIICSIVLCFIKAKQ